MFAHDVLTELSIFDVTLAGGWLYYLNNMYRKEPILFVLNELAYCGWWWSKSQLDPGSSRLKQQPSQVHQLSSAQLQFRLSCGLSQLKAGAAATLVHSRSLVQNITLSCTLVTEPLPSGWPLVHWRLTNNSPCWQLMWNTLHPCTQHSWPFWFSQNLQLPLFYLLLAKHALWSRTRLCQILSRLPTQ